jgi:hypothetical protein
MLGQISKTGSTAIDPLDRVAIAYLTLPLVIFLAGWFEVWVSVPLIACIGYSVRAVAAARPIGGARLPVTPLQLIIAVAVGCGWSAFDGIGHFVFTNADWHSRDAVLHDLVVSPWPVGYGVLDGQESLLRAPVAYYMPAALLGKWAGLQAAHMALAVWTAAGTTLFILQVLSLTPSRVGAALSVSAVVVFFSGLDIVGSLLNDGPRFRSDWDITTHLEWWAGLYQYSSMTTQLFWVPNHAIGGWIAVGLLCRGEDKSTLDAAMPMVIVALALWSPLTAIGLVPFVLWNVLLRIKKGCGMTLLHPGNWAPAVAVGAVVAAYLVLDTGQIPKGMSVGGKGGSLPMDLLRQAQFFLLEAGFIGAAILSIHRSKRVAIALIVLAFLPLARLGAGNDLVMRASIPSLAILAIGACLALVEPAKDKIANKLLLGGLLIVGAITPVAEFARAIVLPAWPLNTEATLIGASCGTYPPHYIARLGREAIVQLLKPAHRLPLGPQGRESCYNPALELMWRGHSL